MSPRKLLNYLRPNYFLLRPRYFGVPKKKKKGEKKKNVAFWWTDGNRTGRCSNPSEEIIWTLRYSFSIGFPWSDLESKVMRCVCSNFTLSPPLLSTATPPPSSALPPSLVLHLRHLSSILSLILSSVLFSPLTLTFVLLCPFSSAASVSWFLFFSFPPSLLLSSPPLLLTAN